MRRAKAMTQVELALAMGRSETWVSEVERDLLPVDRISVLCRLAEVLGVGLPALRPDLFGVRELPGRRTPRARTPRFTRDAVKSPIGFLLAPMMYISGHSVHPTDMDPAALAFYRRAETLIKALSFNAASKPAKKH